jgi:hypothetical protein
MGSGDCTLLNAVWTLLWDPASGPWYLPTILQNGLDADGFKIPPLDRIDVPEFPSVELFKDDVLGHVSIALDKGVVIGVPDCGNLGLSCNDNDPDKTTFTAAMRFNHLVFKGNYLVTSGGLVGCAMSTAAFFLGGGLASALVAAGAGNPENVEAQLDLARAYRDTSLQANPDGTPNRNGQLMVGTYYLHQDTVNEIVDDSANMNVRTLLTAPAAQQMSTQVTMAAQGQQGDGLGVPLPSNGQPAFNINNSIAAVCMAKVIGHNDPDHRYIELLTDQTAFYNSVVWTQKNQPAETHTVDGVLQVVRTADPEHTTGGSGGANIRMITEKERQQLDAETLAARVPEQAMPIYDPEGRLLAFVTLDGPRRIARRPLPGADVAGGAPLPGTFKDTFENVSAALTATISMDGPKFVVAVDALIVALPAVHFELTYSGGGWNPALFQKVENAIANSNGLKNAVTARISSLFNSVEVRQWLSTTLTAEINRTI